MLQLFRCLVTFTITILDCLSINILEPGPKRNKRARAEGLQQPSHDIKFLGKRVKVDTSVLNNGTHCEDEPCTFFNLWKKYF
ncbi:hypothetical protein J6590_039692 [Homalodisca vitripennis]|nr:hypothetical protein J6590_039692 [Homalodisca vitripennis]